MSSSGGFFGRLFGRRPEPVRIELPRVPTSDDLLGALARVEAMVGAGTVPAAVASRVARVARTVRDTVPRLANIGAGSPQAYSVMATATDYLPEAVGGYLRLPRQFADNRPVDRGKTSLMILIDQLDLLAATMDKMFDAVCREDAAALVAHGRFLEEKFGHASTGGGLTLDPGTRIAPDPGTRIAPDPGTRIAPDPGSTAAHTAAHTAANTSAPADAPTDLSESGRLIGPPGSDRSQGDGMRLQPPTSTERP